jgi:hypothetical protein
MQRTGELERSKEEGRGQGSAPLGVEPALQPAKEAAATLCTSLVSLM